MRLSFFVFGATLAAAILAPGARAGEETNELRHRSDRADIAVTMAQAPHARESLVRGEAELAEGRLEEAAQSFKNAMLAAPKSALAARRYCQVMVELGQRDEALSACQKAISLGGSVFDQRALAAAMMAGNSSPTTEDLTVVSRIAQSVKERMEHQPWGYAIECDLARRLGDPNLIRKCADDLARTAPGHYETERALALAAKNQRSPARWFAWLALFGVCVLTAVHALLQKVRRPGAVTTTVVAGILASIAAPARAADKAPVVAEPGAAAPPARVLQGAGFSKWPINHSDPLSSVPTAEMRQQNPVEFGHHLIDLTDAGEAAIKRGDHAKAIEYYKALAKAVPDTSRPFSKICESFLTLGNRQKALEYCTVAIALPGARVVDHGLYATVMLAKPDKLNDAEISDLTRVIDHLRAQDVKEDVAGKLATQITCQVGLRTEDVKWLQQCVDGMSDEPADDPRVITHRFALALATRDAKGAQQVIDVAKHTSMPPEAIRKMEQSVGLAQPLWRRVLGDWRFLVVATALIAIGGVARVAVRRRNALRPA